METLVQQIILGLVNGMVFALIALGYTMVYGIIELINFAHGDLFMLASFLALTLVGLLGLDSASGAMLWLAIPGIILVCVAFAGGLNVVVDRFVYRPLRNAPKLAALVSAIGVSFMFMNLGLFWGGLLGTVMVLGYVGVGMLVSFWSGSNKTSYFVSLGIYVLILVPAQLPGKAQTGVAGQFLQWVNPLAATNHFLSKHLVNNITLSEFWVWLESPVAFALIILLVLLVYAAPGLRLETGKRSKFWSRLSHAFGDDRGVRHRKSRFELPDLLFYLSGFDLRQELSFTYRIAHIRQDLLKPARDLGHHLDFGNGSETPYQGHCVFEESFRRDNSLHERHPHHGSYPAAPWPPAARRRTVGFGLIGLIHLKTNEARQEKNNREQKHSLHIIFSRLELGWCPHTLPLGGRTPGYHPGIRRPPKSVSSFALDSPQRHEEHKDQVLVCVNLRALCVFVVKECAQNIAFCLRKRWGAVLADSEPASYRQAGGTPVPRGMAVPAMSKVRDFHGRDAHASKVEANLTIL